ncbi:hypothetical protein GGQ80_000212 [Sphingomonas jinjuensis]|uniref:Flagellar FliJ protein n=1 Tax=Sphingomonas jinjuensis TaxID=535907 RepID=A0A840F7P6_9SPHN|nr:hypothetical protein [Sphingomonas jinjuensis]MBB4152336.1 hypothetical protein [Sphingomonas jinjuensis]
MADAAKLARIHRVRTLQLGLKRADEVAAAEKHRSESMLSDRIVALADAVAPTMAGAGGFSLAAQAHYRERLHQSAIAATSRVAAAEAQWQFATEATRAAHRDQTAIEKLIARADADAIVKEMRALQDAPPSARKRHDPC